MKTKIDVRRPSSSTRTRRRRRRGRLLLVGLLTAVVLSACGGSNSTAVKADDAPQSTEDSAPPVVVIGTVPMIRGASDRELIVTIASIPSAPSGDQCEAVVEITPYAMPREIVLSINVTSPARADLSACDLSGTRDVTVQLDAPAADRPITFNVTGTPQRFVPTAPGVYSECVAPACDPTAKITEPGTCDNLRQFASLADAPKNFAMNDVRCDGAFAVYGLDFGSGGCAPVEGQPSPCAGKLVHRIYWRATDSGWSIIVWDDTAGCGSVLTTAPDFPTSLCTDLPAITHN